MRKKLAVMGKTLDEHGYVDLLLASIPSSYHHTIPVINARNLT
jgi:hypothetical protein